MEDKITTLDDLPADARLTILEDMRRRHIGFALERLQSSDAQALLRANVKGAVDAVLSAKIEDVMSVDAVVKAVESFLSDASLTRGLRPLLKMFTMLEIARLREDSAPLGDYVPERARADIRQILGLPGFLPIEKMITQITEHEASESVMREVLDSAIKEFQDKVNPFTSDWGLPGLLKKMGPLGLGLAKSLESVQHELEKRIEPELKRFLQSAAKRALKLGASFIVERWDQPAYVGLRRELFSWMLEQPTNEILPLDEGGVALSEAASFEVTRHILTREATRKRRRATIEMMFAAHRKQTVRDALATYGADAAIDSIALADVFHAPLQAWLKSAAALAFIDEVVGSFYDEEVAKVA